MSQPKKIAVFGGGLSAMTAVYNITKQPDWQSKYDITIYQLGWRIGGKGASGLNRNYGNRTEEHGLHLWMGFYENAFTGMREIYSKLNRPAGAPLATFDDAFKGQPFFIFDEHVDSQFIDWKIDFPKPIGIAGDGHVPDVAEIFENLFYMIWEMYHKYKEEHATQSIFSKIIKWIKKILGLHTNPSNAEHIHLIPEFLRNDILKLEKEIEEDVEHATEVLLLSTAKLMANIANHVDFSFHIELLQNIRKWIWDEIGELVYHDTWARRLWYIVDFGVSMMSGLLKDKVLVVIDGKLKLDFNLINQYDYKEWLAMHGADVKITLEAPFIIAMYDGPFAFLKGDVKKPNVEAGTILNIFLRLAFTCKENFVWRMQAGMGDTIFTPFYQLLTKDKKAKFKFFHKLNNLKLSADGKTIEAIEVGRQVTLKPGMDYHPFVNPAGLDCWPSEPNYEYIVDEEAKELIANDINLESNWTPWKDRETITLKLGVDFDEVIIGASLAGIPQIAGELVTANPKWANMVEKVETVQTQAYQFWFNKDYTVLKTEFDKLLSCYQEPVDTFAAMNQLLNLHHWPSNSLPKYLCYLCGVFPDAAVIPPPSDYGFPQREYDRMKQYAFEYLENYFQHLVPGAFDGENKIIYDYFMTLKGEKGKAAWDAQFFKVNIDPSERYVLSVKGSSQHRIKTNETGFSNLYITGDWIQNGLNAGFVEGAVTSGLLTARAVTGDNAIPIVRAPWEIWD